MRRLVVGSLTYRVLVTLRDRGPLKAREVGQILGCATSSAATPLANMRRMGRVQSEGWNGPHAGKWRILPGGVSAIAGAMQPEDAPAYSRRSVDRRALVELHAEHVARQLRMGLTREQADPPRCPFTAFSKH